MVSFERTSSFGFDNLNTDRDPLQNINRKNTKVLAKGLQCLAEGYNYFRLSTTMAGEKKTRSLGHEVLDMIIFGDFCNIHYKMICATSATGYCLCNS